MIDNLDLRFQRQCALITGGTATRGEGRQVQPAIAFDGALAGVRNLGPTQQRHERRPIFGIVECEATQAGQVGGRAGAVATTMQINPVRVVVNQLHGVGKLQERVAFITRLRQTRQRVGRGAFDFDERLIGQPVQLGDALDDAVEQHVEARLAQRLALAVSVAMGERGGREEDDLQRVASGCGLLCDVVVGDGQVGHAHEVVAGEKYILDLLGKGVIAPHVREREAAAQTVVVAPAHAVLAGALQRHDEIGEGFERVCEQREAEVDAAAGWNEVVTRIVALAQVAPRLDGERARAVLAARAAFVERGKQIAHHRVAGGELEPALRVAGRVFGQVNERAKEHAAQGAARVGVQDDGVAGGQFDVQPVGGEWRGHGHVSVSLGWVPDGNCYGRRS